MCHEDRHTSMFAAKKKCTIYKQTMDLRWWKSPFPSGVVNILWNGSVRLVGAEFDNPILRGHFVLLYTYLVVFFLPGAKPFPMKPRSLQKTCLHSVGPLAWRPDLVSKKSSFVYFLLFALSSSTVSVIRKGALAAPNAMRVANRLMERRRSVWTRGCTRTLGAPLCGVGA